MNHSLKNQNKQIDGPSYGGTPLKDIPGGFGPLRSSIDCLSEPDILRARMREEGYLFLPGLLNTDEVLAARDAITRKLEKEAFLDPAHPRMEAFARPGVDLAFRGDLATGDPDVERLLYQGAMLKFWQTFFGEDVLHFDYTWLRAKAPADHTVTEPHCDTVFMNRGTDQLYTTWTPLGAVPFDEGGLMVLEKSHTCEEALGDYWRMDVDTYCSNGPEASEIASGKTQWQKDRQNGIFDTDAFRVQQKLGGRWLATEYQPGDVLMFGMHTLHAASDNRSQRIRLSTDSRYQPASEPVDERWVGAQPIGHGIHSKKGMIC